MKKIKWFLVSVLLSFALIPAIGKAEDLGMQISPLTYNFEIQPGASQEANIIVTNTNVTQLNYVVEVENFNQVSDEGAPSFSGTNPDSSVTTLKDWITLKDKSESEGIIAPKEAKTLEFEISIPQGAEPGGHYAAIFAKEVKKTAEGKTEIGVSSRVGALILVTVPGEVTKSASISSFSFPKFVWRGPVEFGMVVKNTGTTHYDSKASTEISPLFGSKQTADLGVHTIIPNNERSYTGSWTNKYPFGYYKIKGIATDGDGNQVLANGVIWAIPLIIVIPVLVGIILLIWIVSYLRKHVKFVDDDKGSTKK